MTVTENSPGRLVMEYRPWLGGAALIALTLVMVLLGMRLWPTDTQASLAVFFVAAALVLGFVLFIRRIRVTFDVETDTVTIRTAKLTGQEERTLRLSFVQHAFVETSIDRSRQSQGESARRRNTHRAVLQMLTEKVPLNTIYTGGRGAFNAVDAVNTWLSALRKKTMPPADIAVAGHET